MKNNTYQIIIKPKRSWQLIDFIELWQYRELLYIFAWRDVKVRYKQTALGILWVIFQPLVSMIIFTVFFGNLAKIPSGNLPYSLFVLSGLVFWNFFSTALSHSSDSMVSNEHILKKVYFPKIILPCSSIVTSFVDLVINLLILFIFALLIGFVPNVLALIVIPFAILLTSITAVGIGLFLSSFNVKYRDVRYVLPFFIQILLFLTPVIYPLSIVTDRNKLIMALNPMTSVVESVRMIFSQAQVLNPVLILISMLSSVIILFFGLWYFQRTERFFADIV
jgi:lipopolysaccharide transport system permease protein